MIFSYCPNCKTLLYYTVNIKQFVQRKLIPRFQFSSDIGYRLPVNRVHKAYALIKLPFSTLYPSCLCCPSREHPLILNAHTRTHTHTHARRGIKSSSTQMLLYPSQLGQILTSLNCCHMVVADTHQAQRASLIRYSLRLLTRTATLIRGSPKAAN